MPHEIVVEGERRALHDVIELQRSTARAWLRAHKLTNGDALLIAAGDVLRDGAPMPGGLAIVERGAGALVRSAGQRVEVAWRGGASRRAAAARECCRLCFGAFADAEPAVTCACEAAFHQECDLARIDCPACGFAPEGDVR
jgi:hypothetical protein